VKPRFPSVIALLLSAACASAQAAPRSQLATVSQHVAGTRIEIVYRRPVARGRALFGALVPNRPRFICGTPRDATRCASGRRRSTASMSSR
jgi:Protein of unknown function (DUF2911)